MNITGYGQYSKQSAGIRDPRKIMDMQHKLIFVYPMLYADKIKIPNLETLLRDFISVTFLSDIFVQNTFNIIGIANQVRPLWDENRQAIDPSLAIAHSTANAEAGVYTSQPNLPNYPVVPEAGPILQQKITQKTAVIQQLLKTDPKFTKLRPYIEVITLGNMIEIPVIVGTASYPTDTRTLMFVLIAAIGLNIKLNSSQNIDNIFRELETLDETKYWNLLNNLVQSHRENFNLVDYLREKAFNVSKSVSGWKQNAPTIARAAGNLAARLEKQREASRNQKLENPQQLLAPLFLNKTDLDQTKLYFKFVLDPDFARKRFGIEASDEDTKLSDVSRAKLQGELSKIEVFVMSNFSKLVGTFGVSLLRSISNLISASPSSIDLNALTNKFISKDMLPDTEEKLEEILISIDNGLKGSSSDESRNRIKILKSLCKIDSSDSLDDFMSNVNSTSIVSDDFEYDKYRAFLSYFNAMVDTSNSLSSKMETEIKFMVSSQERTVVISRFDNLQKDISSSLMNIFKEFKDELNNAPPCRLAQLQGQQDNRIISQQLIPFLSNGLAKIFYFMFLVSLQTSLCKFILVADVDIETASNEVTAWPNYTLVLPIEIILALHAATMGVSWDHMLRGGEIGKDLQEKTLRKKDSTSGTVITKERNTPMTRDQVSKAGLYNPNESYVKGIIKFISGRLDVPNLIVVDSKKGDIYYKLMNQSDVNKTKIATIDTFIQSKLNRQVISQF